MSGAAQPPRKRCCPWRNSSIPLLKLVCGRPCSKWTALESTNCPSRRTAMLLGAYSRRCHQFSADTARIWRMIGDDCKHNGHPLQSDSADLTTGEEGNRG